MAIDYAEKEREFLATLELDTGRDIAAWMAAIRASGHTQRNDIIDWLRQEGFMFSRASWLERIYANGGLPIYVAGQVSPAAPPLVTEDLRTPATAALPPHNVTATSGLPEATPVPVPTPAPSRATGQRLDALEPQLAAAKAYRPLATYLLAEIGRLVPDAIFTADGSVVVATRQAAFAAIAMSPRELRLALIMDAESPTPPWRPAKLTGLAPAVAGRLTRMLSLTDARQIDDVLRAAIAAAAARS